MKNLFKGLTILTCLMIISFYVDENGIEWYWTEREVIPIIFGVSSLIFGYFWYRYEQKNLE